MPRVLLVNMPYSNLRWPNIGPSLLQAALERRGIACNIAYLNFDFAERIGLDDYYWLADHFGFVLGGERLFAEHYFGERLPPGEDYRREVLRRADPGFGEAEWRRYRAFAAEIGPYLDAAMQTVDWSRYAVVGFASSFQQTMASLCLARRVKALRPQTTIVFGGAACEADMGIELLRLFAEVDYVFLGEADESFPDVVEQLLAGGAVELPAGVAGRAAAGEASDDGIVTHRPEKPRLVDLDALPYPDFDDYFDRRRRSPLAAQVEPLLFFETSRGCWWGERHHCTFCGLNGSRMTYRSKDPQRAVDELVYLTRRHRVFRGCSSDNILDHRYFQSFLPLLKSAGLGFKFEFEMKCNLTRPQVETLTDAGMGAAQLGIETFSTPILKQMDKGSTGVQNLQTLKWISEQQVEIKWNFLWGFPGEDPAEYAALASLVPKLVHLAPPVAWGRVRVDRFSPYFNDPAAYGIVNTRPNAAFRYVFPFPPENLARLAYYFEYDYADGRHPPDYVAPLAAQLERWCEIHDRATLRAWDRGDALILTDTRPRAKDLQRRLGGIDRELYLFCDAARSWPKIAEFVAGQPQQRPLSDEALRRLLDEWIRDDLMVCLDGRYLSLALRAKS